ncbi:MAG TPA: DoxX family protein, partial [Nocardioidaceae bacterium]|nr:DoxX family protein [Nocardioidaceae bacterium]
MSTGILLIRLGLAAMVYGHAAQKLFGWFRGGGPSKTAKVFESWGFRPGVPMVLMAASCEVAAATLLALGLATPLAGAILIGTMIVAASPNFAKGPWAHLGGYEVPLVYGALGFILVWGGPGTISLDEVIGLDATGPGWAFAALVVGVAAALPPLLSRRRNLAN